MSTSHITSNYWKKAVNDMKDEFIDYDIKRQEMASDATLRDYFAAKAMQAIISTNPKVHVTEVSRVAFLAADAMIMERNK